MLVCGCTSQSKIVETKAEQKAELKPPFANQGEQEDFWAQELFKKEYKANTYSKYIGEIKLENENQIRFGDVQSIFISGTETKYYSILTNGLFHPDLLNALSLQITDLEEMEFLSNSPKVKRFRFWLFRPNMANPQVYLFELRNENATEKTDWEKWIKGSKLTFLKDGWIII
tara:strand:+ start:126 stop:641 length:516 start_codon:yes stop_codon:yes gene_type:complete